MRGALRLLLSLWEGFVGGVGEVSPGHARNLRLLASRWGLLLLALGLFLGWLGRAGGQTALTDRDLKALDYLYGLALARDPGVLEARAALASAEAQAAPLAAASAGASLELRGDFDQVRPGYALALRLDLAALLQDHGPALAAARARVAAEERRLYREVAEALFGYLYARAAARQASDRVEAARAALEAERARFRAGAATRAELLASAEALSRAELALYRANLDLAAALARLSEAARVPPEAVRAALTGRLPGDGPLPAEAP